MEGLPYDFASEEDDEDIDKKKPSRRSISAAELLKDIPKDQELEKSDEEKPELTREFEPSVLEEVGDNAPELDGEAPLEHLSRPEAEAIAQVMASDRLQEIGVEEEEVSSESLAAENFFKMLKQPAILTKPIAKQCRSWAKQPLALRLKILRLRPKRLHQSIRRY